jgi:threonine dehydrogenase-like Zn-dependent dehydrogenase
VKRAVNAGFESDNEELGIIGSMAVLNSYAPAIDVIAAGGIDTDMMVTHTFPIDRFAEAVDVERKRQGLKVQVDWSL